MSFQSSALVLAWVAIALLALGFAGLLRQVQALARRPGDTPAGRTPADLVGFAVPATGPLAALQPHRDRDTLVVLTAPGCRSCEPVLRRVAALPAAAAVTVVSLGGCDEARALLAAAGRTDDVACLPHGHAVMDLLAVPATPYLLALAPGGVIRAAALAGEGVDVVAWFGQRAEAR